MKKLLIVSCLLASPVAAAEIDLSQVTSISLSMGNNPVSVTTAAVGHASINTDPGCPVVFDSLVSAGALHIEPSDPDQECLVSVVLPENFPSVKIGSSNGAITFSGNIEKLEISGDNGTASVTNSTFDSFILNNANGSILLDTVSSSATNLRSTNSAISITKLASPFQINATNGPLKMKKTKVPYGSRNSIKKVNGNVVVSKLKVTPPIRQASARLKLTTKTVNGSVRVLNRSLSNRRRTVVSALGTGRNQARLSITTVNAGIILK